MSLDLVRGGHSATLVAPVIGILALVVEPALAIDCAKARQPAEVADLGAQSACIGGILRSDQDDLPSRTRAAARALV